MEFEAQVMEAVKPILNRGETASFFEDSGTLFLNSGLVTLTMVKRAIEGMGLEIQVSAVGDSFAIDFI